jgi:uncharacterized protein
LNGHLSLDQEKIADFCRRNGIRKLSLFGSILTDHFGPDSDVDVLVEFQPDVHIGLIGLAGLEIELTKIIGRKADLRTPQDLSRYFRDRVIASAEVQFAA